MDFFDALVGANPWARRALAKRSGFEPLALLSEQSFSVLRQSACRDRALAGAAEWSRWRNQMLQLGALAAPGLERECWEALAFADFSLQADDWAIDFSGFAFPWDARFSLDCASGPLSLSAAHFARHVHIAGRPAFDGLEAQSIRTGGDLTLENLSILGRVDFAGATIIGALGLRHSIFHDGFWIQKADIAGPLHFENVDFNSDAGLHNAVFRKGATWRNARFFGSTSVQQSRFLGPVSLDCVEFRGRLFADGSQGWPDACDRTEPLRPIRLASRRDIRLTKRDLAG